MNTIIIKYLERKCRTKLKTSKKVKPIESLFIFLNSQLKNFYPEFNFKKSEFNYLNSKFNFLNSQFNFLNLDKRKKENYLSIFLHWVESIKYNMFG